MKKLLFTLLLFSFACGSDDANTKDKNNNNNDDDLVSEIIPKGFDRVSSARISHDGTKIAMVVEKGEDKLLITTSITGDDIKEFTIEGLGYLSTLAWSSDDSQLYVSGDGISRIAIDGSKTEKIVDAFAVSNFDVSPDDKKIAWFTNGGKDTLVGSLEKLPLAISEALSVAQAGVPRFSPDGSKILALSSGDYLTVNIDGSDLVKHTGGAGYLGSASWIDNDSFLFLGNEKIEKFTISSKKVSTVNEDGFAALGLDYNKASGKYLFLINGQKALQMRSLK